MTHTNLMNNYFNPNLVYTEDDFRRRFRMRHHVFERVLHDVHQKLDIVGHPGFSPHKKVTVALRMMVYGSPTDSMDETHDEYLREPNQEDLDWLIHKAKDQGDSGTTTLRHTSEWVFGFQTMSPRREPHHSAEPSFPDIA
ncbi:unnamed protein product [Malus baccata var. baccata]